jgi:hypothetical protein
MALTAAVGTGSASATVLCKKVVGGSGICPTGSVLPAGSGFSFASYEGEKEVFNLTGGGVPIHCNRVAIGGLTTAASGEPLPISGGGIIDQCWQGFKEATANKCGGTFSSTKDALGATGGGAGVLTIGSAAEPLVVSLTCENASKESYGCTFKSGAKPVGLWNRYTTEEGGIGRVENGAMFVTSGNPTWCPVGLQAKLTTLGHSVYESYPAYF